MAATQSGCRTKSSRMRGDSACRASTRLVPRCSATEEQPNTSAAPSAVTTAIAITTVTSPAMASPTPISGQVAAPGAQKPGQRAGDNCQPGRLPARSGDRQGTRGGHGQQPEGQPYRPSVADRQPGGEQQP